MTIKPFKIEQIAINPRDRVKAKELLIALGLATWVEDHVVATGVVFDSDELTNEADLSFNYDAFDGKEFEILSYTAGSSWLDDSEHDRSNSVTHLGMHVTEPELDAYREFFEERGIDVAQEVNTLSHTNPYLNENGRKYHYCIFDTKPILGVDLKFIVRIEHEPK